MIWIQIGEYLVSLFSIQSLSMLRISTIKSSNHEDIWYSCEKCDKSFDREDKLQVHVKFKSAHENIWHLCVKCDNSFAGQDELQKHVRSDHECIWQRQGESLKSWK